MKPSKSAARLLDLIKKAIDDNVVTNAEYDEIIMLANEDNVIDSQEKKLLSNFHDMIENKIIKRVPK